MYPQKILFVCTGNICRSPTAQAIARHKAKIKNLENKFYFDSAGTDSYHQGQAPDARSQQICKEKGISFDKIVARQIKKNDFEDFDLIMCMDRSHLVRLRRLSDEKYHHKIKLFLEFCDIYNKWDDEVIDPYYASDSGFQEVYDVIDKALDKILMLKI